MQTFIPYSNFDWSAFVLDDKRLGNQFYNEGQVLLRGGWPNHPASKMWRGYHFALGCYLLACARELHRRGRFYPEHINTTWQVMNLDRERRMPPWIGDERVHSSHRANLLRKDPQHYGQFNWTEQPTEGYFWPVQ